LDRGMLREKGEMQKKSHKKEDEHKRHARKKKERDHSGALRAKKSEPYTKKKLSRGSAGSKGEKGYAALLEGKEKLLQKKTSAVKVNPLEGKVRPKRKEISRRKGNQSDQASKYQFEKKNKLVNV